MEDQKRPGCVAFTSCLLREGFGIFAWSDGKVFEGYWKACEAAERLERVSLSRLGSSTEWASGP